MLGDCVRIGGRARVSGWPGSGIRTVSGWPRTRETFGFLAEPSLLERLSSRPRMDFGGCSALIGDQSVSKAKIDIGFAEIIRDVLEECRE